jgi:hypothetical protein
MLLRTSLTTALALLATLGALSTAFASNARSTQDAGLRALDGDWLFVEDRTEGRPVEQQQPPMLVKFALRVEEGAVVLVRRDREIRIPIDGSFNDVASKGSTSRYSGEWKDGTFKYETGSVKPPDNTVTPMIKTEMRPTADGLIVRVMVSSLDSTALYKHPKDIALPAPAKATMSDITWLAGAWTGTMGARSIEERWSPPLGGAMLAVSRTVSKEKMVAFEYLRIVERDGGLVYVAQPNGAPPTEFVLTELSKTRAVFENPRHDSPQRIVYELSAEGGLSASIGFIKGGKPTRFEFKREGG